MPRRVLQVTSDEIVGVNGPVGKLNISYGAESWELLDWYRKSLSLHTHALLWLHGGGGTTGTKDINPSLHPFDVFDDVVAVAYGQSQGGATHPKQETSVGKAVQWCRDQGYSKVIAMGNSWGGMLAALVAYDEDTTPSTHRPDGVVLWGAPTDFTIMDQVSTTGTLEAYFTGVAGSTPLSNVSNANQKLVSPWWKLDEAGGVAKPTYCTYYVAAGSPGSITNPHDGYFGTHIKTKVEAEGGPTVTVENTAPDILGLDAEAIKTWAYAL